jgi:hypothetical protein
VKCLIGNIGMESSTTDLPLCESEGSFQGGEVDAENVIEILLSHRIFCLKSTSSSWCNPYFALLFRFDFKAPPVSF